MFVAWISLVKKIVFKWNETTVKFVATVQFTLDLGDIYISALSVSLLNNCLVAVTFDYQEEEPQEVQTKKGFQPMLSVWAIDEASIQQFDIVKNRLRH